MHDDFIRLAKKLYTPQEGYLFGKEQLRRNNSEKKWSLFELMDTDNRILIIAPNVSRSLYMLTYICREQHAAVFSISSATVYKSARVHIWR